MNSRTKFFISVLMAIALTTASSPASAAACSFGGSSNQSSNYSYSFQYDQYIYKGVGGYIYSTQTSMNDVYSDHIVYSFGLNPAFGCGSNYLETGQELGYTYGGPYTSWTLFSFNPNYYINGDGSTCNSGLTSAAFHSYGSRASTNEGYWMWYTGYHFPGDYGETEYSYDVAYGSLSNIAPTTESLPSPSNTPETNSEVYQGDANVACESTDAYWGTNNGTPSTANQLVLSTTNQQTPTFNQWADSSTGISQSALYSWTEFDNWWAAHSYGSPS